MRTDFAVFIHVSLLLTPIADMFETPLFSPTRLGRPKNLRRYMQVKRKIYIIISSAVSMSDCMVAGV